MAEQHDENITLAENKYRPGMPDANRGDAYYKNHAHGGVIRRNDEDWVAHSNDLVEARKSEMQTLLEDKLGVEQGKKIYHKIEDGMEAMQVYNHKMLENLTPVVPETHKNYAYIQSEAASARNFGEGYFNHLMVDMTRPKNGQAEEQWLQELATKPVKWFEQKAADIMHATYMQGEMKEFQDATQKPKNSSNDQSKLQTFDELLASLPQHQRGPIEEQYQLQLQLQRQQQMSMG